MEKLKITYQTYQCHENWNNFTPTQQGAFCKKCQIDVKDFSNLSNSEIKRFLELNKSKHLCGKFGASQIINLNNDTELWHTTTPKIIQTKFVFSILIAFGLTLFSCTTKHQKHQIEKLAKQAY